jgi:hypothetical protein
VNRSLASLVATSLLGVIAVAALVSGVLFFLGAWTIQRTEAGSPFEVGTVAALVVGGVTVAYAALAAFAAREEWLGRPLGAVLGLVVALAAILAAAVALLAGRSDGYEALLYIAAGLGAATAVAVLVATRPEAWTTAHDLT